MIKYFYEKYRQWMTPLRQVPHHPKYLSYVMPPSRLPSLVLIYIFRLGLGERCDIRLTILQIKRSAGKEIWEGVRYSVCGTLPGWQCFLLQCFNRLSYSEAFCQYISSLPRSLTSRGIGWWWRGRKHTQDSASNRQFQVHFYDYPSTPRPVLFLVWLEIMRIWMVGQSVINRFSVHSSSTLPKSAFNAECQVHATTRRILCYLAPGGHTRNVNQWEFHSPFGSILYNVVSSLEPTYANRVRP